MDAKRKQVPFLGALITLIFLIATITVMAVTLGSPPHVPLLIATVFAAVVGVIFGFRWKDMQEGMVSTIKTAMPSILIIMVVGLLIAMWVAGGVIPAMVYYGLQIISPRFFLVTALLLCSLVSLALGSSLSTIGTVGVALFGIGEALGIPGAITAGAIVSGAYFGDKMSPLSDTTNLAPAVAGAGLFDHVRHMLGTTAPTYAICLVIYGILGFTMGSGTVDAGQTGQIMAGLKELFVINPLMLLPPLLVIVMVLFKIPALPGLLAAAFLGLVLAVGFQGATAASLVSAAMNGFSGESSVAAVQTLINRGGLMGMMRTVALALISLSFAGVFERTGMAASIVEKILKLVHSSKGLVIATVLTAWIILIATGQQYVAIIITGRLFKESYDKRNLAPENLSRALEDSGTVFGAIVPHSTGAGFTENALGVSAWQYGPFTFFGWINPLVAIARAAFGRGIKTNPDKAEAK
ncbi:Na+/H+ antiporter NhaC [Oscillospiraceae bacterium OttesenSCG-928-F05]|nr:Na+/H+ antiporter NhaC [Oscillospiraceae bacterium OttesenSCG-928-F05]